MIYIENDNIGALWVYESQAPPPAPRDESCEGDHSDNEDGEDHPPHEGSDDEEGSGSDREEEDDGYELYISYETADGSAYYYSDDGENWESYYYDEETEDYTVGEDAPPEEDINRLLGW